MWWVTKSAQELARACCAFQSWRRGGLCLELFVCVGMSHEPQIWWDTNSRYQWVSPPTSLGSALRFSWDWATNPRYDETPTVDTNHLVLPSRWVAPWALLWEWVTNPRNDETPIVDTNDLVLQPHWVAPWALYALRPTPVFSLILPKHYTPNTKPYTQNPKPQILNPKPSSSHLIGQRLELCHALPLLRV